jgi:hypothetical protein
MQGLNNVGQRPASEQPPAAVQGDLARAMQELQFALLNSSEFLLHH